MGIASAGRARLLRERSGTIRASRVLSGVGAVVMLLWLALTLLHWGHPATQHTVNMDRLLASSSTESDEDSRRSSKVAPRGAVPAVSSARRHLAFFFRSVGGGAVDDSPPDRIDGDGGGPSERQLFANLTSPTAAEHIDLDGDADDEQGCTLWCRLAFTGTPEVCGHLGPPDPSSRLSQLSRISTSLLAAKCVSHYTLMTAPTRRAAHSSNDAANAVRRLMPRRCRECDDIWRPQQGRAVSPHYARAFTHAPRRRVGVGNSGDAPRTPSPPPRDNVLRAQVASTSAALGDDEPRIRSSERLQGTVQDRQLDVAMPNCTVKNDAGDSFTVQFTSFGYPADAFATMDGGDTRGGGDHVDPSAKGWGFMPIVRPHTVAGHRRRERIVADAKYSFDYRDELLAQQLYRRSLFVFTHRRGGWDCWRHLEALAAGALPYMPDLALCGRGCLEGYPKALLADVLQLGGVPRAPTRREFERIVSIGDPAERRRVLDPKFAQFFDLHVVNASSSERRDDDDDASDPSAPPPFRPGVVFVQPRAATTPSADAVERDGRGGGGDHEFRVPTVDWESFDRLAARQLSRRLSSFGRQRLTTDAVVASLLRRLGWVAPAGGKEGEDMAGDNPPLRSLLVFVRTGSEDYMEFAIEHGLSRLGINYTVTAERPFLRQRIWKKNKKSTEGGEGGDGDILPSAVDMDDSEDLRGAPSADDAPLLHDRKEIVATGLDRLHGRGFGYTMRLPPLREGQLRYVGADLERRLRAGEFSAVIYAFHVPPASEHLPMLSIVRSVLPRSRIAIVDGNDSTLDDGSATRLDWAADAASAAQYFRREPLEGCRFQR